MQPHKIVSRQDWIEARKAHMAHEKEFTRARDRLSEERRALPWVKVDKSYVFDGPNGKQTLGENIADVAGLSAAYDGYHASLAGKLAPMQDGYSGDQQFFIAFGQNWGRKDREAALRQQVMTDPHSPAEFRADTVRNIDAWYSAFEVQSGEKLYLAPTDRVRIW